jgi:hypothetical protein
MDFIRQIFHLDKPEGEPDEYQRHWIKLFSPKEYEEFVGLVTDYLKQHDIEYTFKEGYIYHQGTNVRIDLREAAQACRSSKKDEWKEIIESTLKETL